MANNYNTVTSSQQSLVAFIILLLYLKTIKMNLNIILPEYFKILIRLVIYNNYIINSHYFICIDKLFDIILSFILSINVLILKSYNLQIASISFFFVLKSSITSFIFIKVVKFI